MTITTIIAQLKAGHKFTGKHFTGIVTPISVCRNDNTLKVNCEKNGSLWDETWNLLHTVWGFEENEYTFIQKKCIV